MRNSLGKAGSNASGFFVYEIIYFMTDFFKNFGKLEAPIQQYYKNEEQP